jgi:hypothetical protein
MRSWLGPDYKYLAQGGEDFGARLRNGFANAFASGRQQVLAITGDCPELDTATLFEVITRLHRADLVLGPANDGGLFLVALRRAAGELFERIPWATQIRENAEPLQRSADYAAVLRNMNFPEMCFFPHGAKVLRFSPTVRLGEAVRPLRPRQTEAIGGDTYPVTARG